MNPLGAVASFELLKLGKRGKVGVIAAWTALIIGIAAAAILLGYVTFATPEGFLNWILQPMLFLFYINVAACMLAGDVVASEFENKTCFISFTNPIKRSTLLLGKYLACLAVFIGALFAYFLASSLIVYWLFGAISPQIILAFMYSVAVGAATLGVVFVFSTLMKGASSTISSLLLLTFALQLITTLALMWGIEPWFILNYAALIINSAIQPLPGGPNILVSIAVVLTYTVAALMSSITALGNKEFS